MSRPDASSPIDPIRRWMLEFQPAEVVVRTWNTKQESDLDEAARASYRVVFAWRITRLICRFKSLIGEDQGLRDIPARAWLWDPVQSMPKWKSEASRDLQFSDLARLNELPGGVPLEPPFSVPAIPDASPTYAPLGRDRFFDAVELLTDALEMRAHQHGRLGAFDLTHPDRRDALWPSRDEMFAFEDVLFDGVWEQIVEFGPRSAAKTLVREHGFDPREAREVVASAQTQARDRVKVDLEEQRVLLLARLEAVYQRATESLDIKAQTKALRDMAAILGLTRAEPEDLLREVTSTVRKLNRELGDPTEPKNRLLQAPLERIIEIPARFRRDGASSASISHEKSGRMPVEMDAETYELPDEDETLESDDFPEVEDDNPDQDEE